MKHARPVPTLLAFALLAGGSFSLAARAQEAEVSEAELGAPFTLGAGETARIGDDGLEVTLRSITEESGCVTDADCSVMMFKGTLVMRLGEQRAISDVDASFFPSSPFAMNFAQHKIEILDVRRAAKHGPLQTTMRVTPQPEDQDQAAH